MTANCFIIQVICKENCLDKCNLTLIKLSQLCKIQSSCCLFPFSHISNCPLKVLFCLLVRISGLKAQHWQDAYHCCTLCKLNTLWNKVFNLHQFLWTYSSTWWDCRQAKTGFFREIYVERNHNWTFDRSTHYNTTDTD